MEMKSDVARLPGELAKMPSVSVQLKMDEYSTISKLAKSNAPPPVSQSVITKAPPTTATPTGRPASEVVRSKSPKISKEQAIEKKTPQHLPMIAPMPPQKQQQQVTTAAKYQLTYAAGTPATGLGSGSGTQVQLPPGSGIAVQTAEGNLVVYSVSSSANTTQTVSLVQGGSVAGGATTISTNSGGQQQAYTIGVPAYLDRSNLFQTVQILPAAGATGASTSQQVVYWPSSVVGNTQSPAAAQGAAVATGTVGTSQLAVVQQGQVLQPVQFGVEPASVDSSASGKKSVTPSSVITID